MDQELLHALLSTLSLLCEARCRIEGEAALLRSVNTDLAAVLRRLQAPRGVPSSGDSQQQQQAPAGARQQQQQHGRSVAAGAARRGSVAPGGGQSTAVAGGSTAAPPQRHHQQHRGQLPADFTQQLAQYHTLLEQSAGGVRAAHPGQQGHTAQASARAAAAGFMQHLEQAYGPSQQQAGQATRVLTPGQFAEQARFLGLVSAALWAVQKLKQASSCAPAERQQLHQVLPILLPECQQWLAEHSQKQQQGSSTSSNTAASAADAALWRNRCLRGLLSAAPPLPSDAPPSASVCAMQPPGLWLPQDCWQPLSRGGGSGVGWQSLLPCQPAPGLTHQQLRYTDVSELVHHSRQLQQIQQLLLQLAVESTAAPKLIELLLRGCMDAQRSSTRSTASSRPGRWTPERCCALYRLVSALAAGPVKQRGLGPSVQLAEEQQVATDLIDWE